MKKLIWFLVGAFVFRLVLAFIIWHPDVNNHIDWGTRFWEYGAKAFYSPETNVWSFTWPNQPPGTMYMFAGIRKLFEAVFNAFWWINVNVPAFPSGVMTFFESNLYPALLKLPAILADFGIAYILYLWTKKKLAAVIWLVNPIVWYNSSLWGQYDAVINFFAILSFYLLSRRKLVFALLAIGLSLYIKASLLIFLPIWLIIAFRQKYQIKDWIMAALSSTLVFVIISLPFSHGNPIVWLYNLYANKIFVQQLHIITANAFNLWAGLTGIHERPDIYQYWGYILFSIAYIPLLLKIYKKQDLSTIAWVLALGAFSSFMLLTNMHERYLYPLFPYLTILVALDLKLLVIYISISLIHLLNLYNFWWFPNISFIKDFLSFGNRITPRILGIAGMVLYILTYKTFLRQTGQSRL